MDKRSYYPVGWQSQLLLALCPVASLLHVQKCIQADKHERVQESYMWQQIEQLQVCACIVDAHALHSTVKYSMYVFPKPTVTKIQLQHVHVQMLGDFQVQKRQMQVFLSCGSIGGTDQSCLIATFSTRLFLWRAEGWLSPHYSLRWEAETGCVERKDRERNPLELISINHSILEH